MNDSDWVMCTYHVNNKSYRVRRTMFKTLREEVQEMEVKHEDPAKVMIKATRKKYVLKLLPDFLFSIKVYLNCNRCGVVLCLH